MRILSREAQEVDITRILLKLQKEYKTLYIYQFEDLTFIYRPIGRKEYKDIFLNENISDAEKEEYVCFKCVLYPENFDFSNCDEAGVPTALAAEIINNSYLSAERRERVLNYFRQDMYDLDNQMTCIILEAFPNLDMETVENWDIETTCKYYSRAEWTLHNLHGIQFKEKDPNAEFLGAPEELQPKTEELDTGELISKAKESKVSHDGKPKKKQGNTTLTPEKLRELKAKYPDIDWEHDDGQRGIEGLMDQKPVYDESPALWTPSQWKAMKGKPRTPNVPKG